MPIIVSGPTNVSAHDDGVARLHVGEHAVRPYAMVGHRYHPKNEWQGKKRLLFVL